MSDPKTPAEMLDALGAPFPPQAIEKRKGAGGRMYDYVAAETVIRRLNSATNGEWSFVVRGHEWRGDVLITWGELTIPGLGTRSGFGVQAVAPNAGEDLIKGSASDCLKKCATQFGVALELYGPDLEAGEIASPPPQQRPQSPRAPQRATRPQDAPKAANPAPASSADREAVLTRIHDKAPADLLEAIARVWRFPNFVVLPFAKLQELDALLDGTAPKARQEAFNAWKFKYDTEAERAQAELLPTPAQLPDPNRHTHI